MSSEAYPVDVIILETFHQALTDSLSLEPLFLCSLLYTLIPNACEQRITMSRYYVSITGMNMKSILHYPLFYYHAIPCTMQAQSAPGNVSTSVKYIRGMEHTLEVWEDRESMLKYLRTGAHLQAMKNSKNFGSYGKVYGYYTDTIPSWSQARQLWEEKGSVVFGKPCKEFGDAVVSVVGPKQDGKETMVSKHSKSFSAVAMIAASLVVLAAFVVAAGVGPLARTVL
jgi:hypothetical protein